MSLFGRKKGRCYSCGGDVGVEKCGCGRYYCVAHGFSGSCFECQATSMTSTEYLSRVDETSQETPIEAREGDLIPRLAHASIHHDPVDDSSARESIMGDLERYRHVFFTVMKIEADREITVHYHMQYIASRISVGSDRLEFVTDLSKVPDRLYHQSSKDWIKYAKERPLEDETFVSHVQFLHNENLLLMEVIIRSMGVGILNVDNELPMEMVPTKIMGTCPFCGTVCRGVRRCQTCQRDIPEEMELRRIFRTHARRQYGDKLVAIRASRMEEGMKREMVSRMKARIRAIDEM